MRVRPLLYVLLAAGAFAAVDVAPSPRYQAVNADLADLGRHLFFDKRLSGDWSVSCASCHSPMHGWSDGQALARGYSGAGYAAAAPDSLRHFRNTPGLYDAKFAASLGADGRYGDLNRAVHGMLTGVHFMHADAAIAVERVAQAPQYRAMWQKAYGKDRPVSEAALITALAEFLRGLSPGKTPYDRYLAGERRALSAQAQRGLSLFRGKAGCAACHAGTQLSDGKFHRLGVPEHPQVADDPLRMMTMLNHYAELGLPDYMNERRDVGRYAVTRKPQDLGKFRTPGLRGLHYTAPYMHNGMFKTLDEVIEFYDRGGGRDAELKPLRLATDEKKALVALLEAMSGEPASIQLPTAPAFALNHVTNTPPPYTDAMPADGSFAALAPLPPAPAPANNPISADKIALGKKLFWDKRLSGNGTMACVSCHLPALGWGDGQAISRGYAGTKNWRNSRTVLNAAYYDKLFWDGRAASLEEQAAKAAQSAIEGNGNLAAMEMRLRFVPEYVADFKRIFGTEWPRIEHAWQAIASYERTLVSDSAKVPLDRYLNGDKTALSPAALRGYELFRGKANCISCHNGPLASDQKHYALGVPAPDEFRGDSLHQITVRWKGNQTPQGAVYATDLGLYLETRDARDIGKFRTPSLRELKYTAPYMHNGAFAQLIDVVKFFNHGGTGKSPLLKPLGLTEREEKDLVAFLEALSMDAPLLDSDPKLPETAKLK